MSEERIKTELENVDDSEVTEVCIHVCGTTVHTLYCCVTCIYNVPLILSCDTYICGIL